MEIKKIVPFLWYDNQAQEAIQFYCSVFKNSKIINLNPMVSEFELEGQRFMAGNFGPQFKFNEAVSMLINCETQDEVDYLWTKLTENGGEESRCGWAKDKYGLWWQIVPTILGKLMSDPAKSKAVMDALLKMNKIIIADLQNAYDGK